MTRNESKSDDAPKLEGLDFEDALAQLEQIVRSLDAGQSSLEKSLQDYEKGIRLLRHCHAKLQNAEQRIEILKNVTKDGSLTIENAGKDQFLTDVAQPGQHREGKTQDLTTVDWDERPPVKKIAQKKRVPKTFPGNNFNESDDVPFDFD